MQRERDSLIDNTIRRLRKRARRIRERTIDHAAVVAETSLEAIGVSKPSALLLLGHMRSGSTLLLHLLMTNPEISARGERGAVYGSRAEFARLTLATRIARRFLFRRLRYVADQVNHNHLTPDSSLLQDPRVKLVFILRRPEFALASILELYRAHYEQPWSVSRAVEYYVERLAVLAKLGESLPNPTYAALITYEALTESPEETLEALRSFLGLRQGFSQNYNTHSFTGLSGDPGPNIAVGRIVRKVPTPRNELSVSELKRATGAYLRCCGALARFALHARQQQLEPGLRG